MKIVKETGIEEMLKKYHTNMKSREFRYLAVFRKKNSTGGDIPDLCQRIIRILSMRYAAFSILYYPLISSIIISP